MFNSNLHSNIRLLDSRIQQSYNNPKPEKVIRNGNKSLQRNMVCDQPLVGKKGQGQLNQSVEGDIVKINSKFSPKVNERLIYANGEVKRTNSSIKFNAEANDEVMPLEGQTNSVRIKSGRMCSTLNHFYKKSPIMKKNKQKQATKVNAYQHENDYSTNERGIISRAKY